MSRTKLSLDSLDCSHWATVGYRRQDTPATREKLQSFWQSFPDVREAAQASMDVIEEQFPEISQWWINLAIDPEADDMHLRCTLLFQIPGRDDMSIEAIVDWSMRFADWWVTQDTFDRYLNVPYWEGASPALAGR